jgi:hypothetical protein
MKKFQHILWGYELTYPDDWVHKTVGDAQAFAENPQALTPGYMGPKSGHLLVSAEWNADGKPVEPIWKQHIARVASMIGAKKVASAPWHMGGGVGIEAEIRLPKRDRKRMWAGVLMHGLTVLKFVVVHPLEERSAFEPPVTEIIKSLHFPRQMAGIEASPEGLPLPPDYAPLDPTTIIPDIVDPQVWRAYDGSGEVGALQAFYVREAPVFGWQIEEYVPFPGNTGLNFARLRIAKGERQAILGIMPFGDKVDARANPGKLAVKFV